MPFGPWLKAKPILLRKILASPPPGAPGERRGLSASRGSFVGRSAQPWIFRKPRAAPD
jgi:hypothetical protein